MDGEAIGTNVICQKVRTMILQNKFLPSQRINQSELADTLGVSRTPVIKALHMLVAEGLLDNIPNRGFYVHKLSLRELYELFMIRQCFEMISAMYAAEYGTEAEIDLMASLFAPFINHEPIDKDQYFTADRQFHTMLFDMCDNTLLKQINGSMQILSRAFVPGLLRPPQETLKEHLEIIAAIRAHDPLRAQEAARIHIEVTKRMLHETERQIRILSVSEGAQDNVKKS